MCVCVCVCVCMRERVRARIDVVTCLSCSGSSAGSCLRPCNSAFLLVRMLSMVRDLIDRCFARVSALLCWIDNTHKDVRPHSFTHAQILWHMMMRMMIYNFPFCRSGVCINQTVNNVPSLSSILSDGIYHAQSQHTVGFSLTCGRGHT